MPIIEVYIDDETYERLATLSREMERDPDELASSAVEEAARQAFRNRDDDPAKATPQ